MRAFTRITHTRRAGIGFARESITTTKGNTMVLRLSNGRRALWFLALACAVAQLPHAHAASCTTQSQMTAAQRNAVAGSAHSVLAEVQRGDVQALREITMPSVAADFSGMMNSVQHLEPQVRTASITVDEIYVLDASNNQAGAPQTDFYCGSPVVVFNIPNLPPGMYALAILHATGVPQPQQISVILSATPDGRWLLAGMFEKPMTAAGHDGLWYWVSARNYAQAKRDWDAWFYYRMASNLLDPLDFLSSPNLERLHREADQIRPGDFPGSAPMTLLTPGGTFAVTAIDTTTEFGKLDLDVHYIPDSAQAAQLSDPPMARMQVTGVMSALVRAHPELTAAFHGIWVHADQGTGSLFALELPMDQIAGSQSPAVNSVAR